MSHKVLMRGSHIIGEAAVRAGCRFYAGYPITPQNELTEYMAGAMARLEDGTFIQAESELAAVNMVIGAAMTGVRAMTSSSSPGISLKQEGISYLAAQELPAVIVNTMRGGPGLGNIAPTQGDYFQATKGGGHGDYRTIVLAPASGQELAELTRQAFDYADKYLTPVLILGDGMMGQMMEPVVLPDPIDLSDLPPKPWILDGADGRPRRLVKSLLLDTALEEEHNWKLMRKYDIIAREITRAETHLVDDARLVVIAYGTAARIAKGAVKRVRDLGLKVGLMRPVTLYPFPNRTLVELSRFVKDFLVFEMSTGQMVEDVKLALEGRSNVHFYGRPGGIIPTPDEIAKRINTLYHRQHLEEE
ncbi:MAG: 3-methyl-2-oxobutanoate dehydrogenase subunit VorB [Deltaproteobacteria bacterium]|nr:3-methyl-2-oxobutanoate dehydrogenase subunit VorB [Deltaproteobacteria bacterium]MBW2018190.1 3-methyl-2-oxobutanoate dehydrogenase subunit VorB [Deltaproteobacteria bacterium]MBW2129915.1 3-methyl-2-oxobutanoate dehydrogenase subunit VorB [Deltaproteobacteria bacterium]MBW2305248.1 3-methyl-2-oxobutanoate dehydrogenase subunit VorB [Deltaproteobacteria bacterium]